jgi:hypothetical protein
VGRAMILLQPIPRQVLKPKKMSAIAIATDQSVLMIDIFKQSSVFASTSHSVYLLLTNYYLQKRADKISANPSTNTKRQQSCTKQDQINR